METLSTLGLSSLVPYRLRQRLNVTRRASMWRAAGVVFIHIPKAAGTSISRELYGRTLGHYSFQELERWAPELLYDCIVFTVVRDPYDRAVSAYDFARRGGTESMGMQHASRYSGQSFDSFEKFACDWLPSQDPNRLDNVFLPQSHFTDGGRFDHIGRLEHLHVTETFLEEALGRKVRFDRINATRDRKEEGSANISLSARNAIRAFYAADFEAFSY